MLANCRDFSLLREEPFFEILKAYHDHCDIIEGLPLHRAPHDHISRLPSQLVDASGAIFVGSFPDLFDDISRFEFVKNAIASQNDEIMVILDSERLDFRVSNHDIGIATHRWHFGFDVSKGPGDTQPTWENAVRPIKCLHLFLAIWSLPHGLSLCSVDLTTTFYDPALFRRF